MNRELFDIAGWLVDLIAGGLKARGGEGVENVLSGLARQPRDEAHFHEPQPRRIPAVRHFAEATAEVMAGEPHLAAALAAIEEHLQWRRSEAYSDAVLGPGFMDDYGWCQLVGPHGFFGSHDFLLGLLLLGPGRHYRDHYHPAPELYWPLTGPCDWKRGAGGFVTREAFEVIWHRPFIVHATKTLENPLLAVWCWTGDTGTPAKLVGQ